MVGRPFPKGVSGNPSGRPKVLAEVRELARKYTEEAIDTLASIMRDKKQPAAARGSAATELLNRGYGKPTQHIEANVNFLDRLSIEDQRALAAALDAVTGGEEDAAGGAEGAYH